MAKSDDFIGSGWGFPLRTDATGGIALVSKERELEDKNTELRARLQDAQIEYVLSLNSDASVYDADTVFEVPERRAASRGRAERAGRRPTGPASLRSHRWTRGGAVSDARVPWPRRARAVRPQQARARVGRADDEAPRRRRSA